MLMSYGITHTIEWGCWFRLAWSVRRRHRGHETLTQFALSMRLIVAKALRRLQRLDEAEYAFKVLAGTPHPTPTPTHPHPFLPLAPGAAQTLELWERGLILIS